MALPRSCLRCLCCLGREFAQTGGHTGVQRRSQGWSYELWSQRHLHDVCHRRTRCANLGKADRGRAHGEEGVQRRGSEAFQHFEFWQRRPMMWERNWGKWCPGRQESVGSGKTGQEMPLGGAVLSSCWKQRK